MKNTTLGQLAPCMVAAMLALVAGPVTGQEVVGGTIAEPIVTTPYDDFESEVIESAPLESAPMAKAPDDGTSNEAAPITSAPIKTGTYVGDLPACSGDCSACSGDCDRVSVLIPRRYGRPDLFYNYYTQGYANQVNAQMYLSPLPIPPNVGHTFYTYQPFYPEEMLYCHKDRFHRYYDNGRGMNRTHTRYYSPPIRQAFCNLYWNYLRCPR